jgi:hypothetical protein
MCDESRGHVIVNGVGPCYARRRTWVVGVVVYEVVRWLCARGDVRLCCRIYDVFVTVCVCVCCGVRCGGGVFVGDWST